MRRGGMFGYGAWPSVARTGDNKLKTYGGMVGRQNKALVPVR